MIVVKVVFLFGERVTHCHSCVQLERALTTNTDGRDTPASYRISKRYSFVSKVMFSPLAVIRKEL